MDTIALRAKERGYPHWRTIATEKSCAVPHDNYGLLDSGRLLGLRSDDNGMIELQVEGKSQLLTRDIGKTSKKNQWKNSNPGHGHHGHDGGLSHADPPPQRQGKRSESHGHWRPRGAEWGAMNCSAAGAGSALP